MPRSAEYLVKQYGEAKTIRSGEEADWKMCSAYCYPRHYNKWQTQGTSPLFSNSNETVRRMIYDSTGIRSLPKYVAIVERLATPNNIPWAALQASDPKLMKIRRVKAYFEELTRRLAEKRKSPRANFRLASNEMYGQLGTYGNGPIFVGRRRNNALSNVPGVIYRSLFFGDIFWLLNDQGEVDTVFRRYHLNVRQYKQQWGENAKQLPAMAGEWDKPSPDETKMFEFVQVTYPRESVDYDPEALDARRHPVCSRHVAVMDKMFVGDEEGFRSPPILTPRTTTVSGNPYGSGPAGRVLASMGGASQIKKTNLKQGNMAGDPTILAADDGALNGQVDLRPGHVNYGGIDRNGKKMIDILPTGNYQINAELLADERSDIQDGFLVTLFQILIETPEMTATEVLERMAEKAAMLSPTMGHLQSEWLGPCIEREIDVLDEIGALADLDMPPELIEARGSYQIIYTSPLAKGEYAEEVSGFARLLDMTTNVVNVTQDPSPFDHMNFDVALPEIANNMAVPVRWMATEDEIAQKRAGRSQQQQQSEMMKNAPALASALKTTQDMQSGGGSKRP